MYLEIKFPIIKKSEPKKVTMITLSASFMPVYLIIPEYDLKKKKLVILIISTNAITEGKLTRYSFGILKLKRRINAKPMETILTHRSTKKINHLGVGEIKEKKGIVRIVFLKKLLGIKNAF